MSAPTSKHPCPDCRHCQWCGDDRCRLCRRSPADGTRKLAMAEQIARYEAGHCSGRCRNTPSAPLRAKPD